MLVVDDEKANRHLLAELLTRIGFDVRVVARAEKMLRLAEEWQPRHVQMGLAMPGMDGREEALH